MLSSRPVEIGMSHNIQYAKTPGRMKNRGENATRPPLTGAKGLKGKEMQTQTPHAAQLAGKLLSMTGRGKPLGDKTPFPNRVANQNYETPGVGKISKPSFELIKTGKPEKTLEPAQIRPSSLRKNARSPNIGKNFKTPANKGNHWECGEISFTTEEPETQEAAPQDDFDEIEYMAPNTLDLPYTPPFDFELPDFKQLGKTLYTLALLKPYPDSPPPEIHINCDDLPTSWDILELPPLESDDPFKARDPSPSALPTKQSTQAKPRLNTVASSRLATTSKPVPGVQKSATATRSATATSSSTTLRTAFKGAERTAIARPTAPPRPTSSSRMTAVPSRPATAAAIRAPVASRAAFGAAVKRPTTSAANYKTTSIASRSTIQRSTSGIVGARKAATAARADTDVDILKCGELALDDFRFDV